MLLVKAGKFTFGVNEEGNQVCWKAEGLPMASREGGDFWRMYIDDFKFRDCPVHSAKQAGKAVAIDNGVEITYDKLLDDKGRTADVTLIVRITAQGEALKFDAHIENHDERFRLNEFKLPFMDMKTLGSRKRAQDILYRPNGLGEKIPNPWDCAKMPTTRSSSQEYLEPTQHEVFRRKEYPGHLSMGWFGVETGDHFLYLAQQDELFRTCDLTYGARARTLEPSLLLEITHFPVVKYQETEDIAPTFASLFEGDWRTGAAYYRQWANDTWWTDPVMPDWMKNWTGREKVILRHGNGQILHTYEEIPSIMKKALECGIPLLEVYGWHPGGQDNDYPNYMPDPEQGGEEGLLKAIEEVHKMGGRISLYGQGELLDTWNDYFKETGYKICRKNIMGDPYYCFFNYSSGGSLMRRFRCNITHTTVCQTTQEWNDMMCGMTRKFLDYGADGVFWDMQGGPTPVICFDESHPHGSRGDREALGRSKNVKDVHAITLERNVASGIEFPIDFLGKDADYTMGCWEQPPHPFFDLFRHTFPEIVMTNRWCDDENEGYIAHLNEDFLYGLRWNICMFRTRGTLYDVPNFAEHLKKLTALQVQYGDYLLRGKFCVETPLLVPDQVKYTEFKAEGDDNRRLFCLWNRSGDVKACDVKGQHVILAPNSVACVEWVKEA